VQDWDERLAIIQMGRISYNGLDGNVVGKDFVVRVQN